jgi:hypothetical protein
MLAFILNEKAAARKAQRKYYAMSSAPVGLSGPWLLLGHAMNGSQTRHNVGALQADNLAAWKKLLQKTKSARVGRIAENRR